MAFLPQLREWFFREDAPVNPRGKSVNLAEDGQPDQDMMERLVTSTIFKLEREDRAKQRQGLETLDQLAGWVEIAADAEILAYQNGLDETPFAETTKVVHPQQLTEVAQDPSLTTVSGITGDGTVPGGDIPLVGVEKDGTETRRNKFLLNGSTEFIDYLNSVVTNLNNVNGAIYGPGGIDNPGGGSVGSYFNDAPMPEKVGGWDAGSTFDPAVDLADMWTGLLYPFQVPVISITAGTLFKTFEVGEFLPTTTSVGYTVSNIVNIAAPNDGNLASDIGAALFPVNPITLAASGNFDVNFPASTTETSAVSREVSLTGLDTQANTPAGTGTILFRWKRYWGSSLTLGSVSDADIIAAINGGSEFATGNTFTKTFGGQVGGNAAYSFVAWPSSFGDPAGFKFNGFNTTGFVKIVSVGFTNASGGSTSYDIWQFQTAAQNSSAEVQVL